MSIFLRLAVIAEPDRYRFARFVLEAVDALHGDVFSCAAALVDIMPVLRRDHLHKGTSLEVSLTVVEDTLYCEWSGCRMPIVRFELAPSEHILAELGQRLRLASESSDPDLLIRRNRQIEDELASARARAAIELSALEEKLENKKAELRESRHAAEVDSLTSIYNRGAYDDRLQEAILRCARQSEPLCLILMDLDYFKKINDQHGHQYGDEYLKRMAQIMRESVREYVDIPCRMGGDEFAIIVFAGVATAKRIAERVLVGMSGKVSIGIAFLLPNDSLEMLVGRSDAALYEAKRNGRGRIAVSDEIVIDTSIHVV